MITYIHIQNFRCFNSTKAKGFSRINLFGGRNNAGKTALLETLFLMGKPSNQSINSLSGFRGITRRMFKEMPTERVWNNFFHQQDKKLQINLEFELDGVSGNKVSIVCDEKVDDFINLVTNETENRDNDVLEFAHHLETTNSIKSSLRITSYFNEKELQKNIFVASSEGRVGRGIEHTFINANFISANGSKKGNEVLAREFGDAKKIGDSNKLLKALQIVDSSIKEVDVLPEGEWCVHLKRDKEKPMLLSLFGDAMNKIADIVLTIINNKNSILLIDEIENGIHYENQEEIWRTLFELCEDYNVQLFATSHSYEMIKAFANYATESNKDNQASYFEMSRHPVSNKIDIQKLPLYSLIDKLNNHRPVRG